MVGQLLWSEGSGQPALIEAVLIWRCQVTTTWSEHNLMTCGSTITPIPSRPLDCVYDMETRDPDDFLALCLLLSQPSVNLRAVTLNPGSPSQVGLVRRTLEIVGQSGTLVGSLSPHSSDDCIDPIHFDALGRAAPSRPDGLGFEVLAEVFKTHPSAVLVTGAPLDNVHELLMNCPGMSVQRWVGQGGFAGKHLVTQGHRLPGLGDRVTARSHNLSQNPLAANAVLETRCIARKELIPKDLTHGLFYDRNLHSRVAIARRQHAALGLIHRMMELFLARHPKGKRLHDPLAAAVAIEPTICTFHTNWS